MTGASLERKTERFYKDYSDYQSDDTSQPSRHSESSMHRPVVCSGCGAVQHNNRWSWGIRPADFNETHCPACLRIQDRLPAGILTVRGDCFRGHRNEILHLIRSTVNKTGKQHPLKRIMDMEYDDIEAVFTFTDAQLPREIGDALQQSYEGELEYRYNREGTILRVIWQR